MVCCFCFFLILFIYLFFGRLWMIEIKFLIFFLLLLLFFLVELVSLVMFAIECIFTYLCRPCFVFYVKYFNYGVTDNLW